MSGAKDRAEVLSRLYSEKHALPDDYHCSHWIMTQQPKARKKSQGQKGQGKG